MHACVRERRRRESESCNIFFDREDCPADRRAGQDGWRLGREHKKGDDVVRLAERAPEGRQRGLLSN